jgi:hypothetical protein
MLSIQNEAARAIEWRVSSTPEASESQWRCHGREVADLTWSRQIGRSIERWFEIVIAKCRDQRPRDRQVTCLA